MTQRAGVTRPSRSREPIRSRSAGRRWTVLFRTWLAQEPRTVFKPEFLLALLLVAIRLPMIWHFLPFPPVTETMRAGWTLGQQGYLGDPFILPTGPTAHVAPMYPGLLAMLLRMVGEIPLAFAIARSVLVVLLALVVMALPWASRALGLGRMPGLLASALFVPMGTPAIAWIELQGQHETLLTFAWLFFLVIGTLRFLDSPRQSSIAGLLAVGALWGAGAHTSPLLLTSLSAMTLVLLLRPTRTGWRLPFRSAVLMAIGATLAIAPWTIRNYRTIGQLTLIRDNFGLELDVSNADDATYDMRDNFDTRSMHRHPYFNSTAALRMAMTGERTYYAERSAEARAWIRDNPGRFTVLTAQRAVAFFFPKFGLQHHTTFYLFVMLMGGVGLWMLFRENPWMAGVLSAVVLGYAAPHFVVQSHERYSYAILWIPMLLAGLATGRLWHTWRKALR